ncbi:MAG TPA: HAMP domain-containing sensor histidine kinase [Acidobacteriaceae bacterium]|jgi:signal transduction histidine kinase
MSSRIVERGPRTAAWRISVWSAVAFAIGTAIAFWFLQDFLATDIQNRADSWLTGELGVLADVAQRTPGNRLHDVVVREVAELASREVPHEGESSEAMNRAVFFIETGPDGQFKLHTGAGTGEENLLAINRRRLAPGRTGDVRVPGFSVPFRVASAEIPSGDHIYLALSKSYEQRVLLRLRWEFAALWCGMIAFGSAIVFISTRRMLHRVQVISETASSIGRSNLASRVPVGGRNDEISQLSSTFNKMLDRIEASVQQLHTMSDSLAHDLRSPLTSIRGKLEMALMSDEAGAKEEAIVNSIEQLDRLSTLLSTSLDVSEANADALRLRREAVDLEATVRSLGELYEPVFAQAGLTLIVKGKGPIWVQADAALLQRTMTNLFDNELKHVMSGRTITVTVQHKEGGSSVLVEDDGSGFPAEILPRLFEKYVKGTASDGHGLGLAFVAAVVRSHNGAVSARNRQEGGASIAIELP